MKVHSSMSKDFTVTILGCSSAVPTKDRFPTSQLVSCYGRHYLLDCGEGTQIQLRKYKISFQRIDRIFISHLHADHFLGLPGLLSTMDLIGRKKEIHIHAFDELNIFMNGFLQSTYSEFSFPVHIHVTPKKKQKVLFENDHISIETFPVKHSIPCNGFIIKEKVKPLNLKKEVIEKYHPTIPQIIEIKKGGDLILDDGKIIPNKELTAPPLSPKSYAFITDTIYYAPIIPLIKGVDLLYHESTFAEDLLGKAKATMHSTAAQAAQIALKAEVQQLMLGHYSVRYLNTDVFLKEAKEIFENTVCATEGIVIEV